MNRSGLTLIELVVVLAILATLTMVAVVSTEGVVEQGRFDVTQRTLQNIDDAVLGPQGQPEAASFVSDIGRLPQAVSFGGELQPMELWLKPDAVRSFGPAPLAADLPSDSKLDADVTLLVGWRGPYLRLPPGVTKLRDGWGSPFALLQPGGAPITEPGQTLVNLASTGTPGSPPYDFTTAPLTLPVAFDAANWTGTVQGSVEDTVPSSAGIADATVRLFVADPEKPSGIRVMTYTAKATHGYRYVFPVPEGDAFFNDADADSRKFVPVGPKAIRVEHGAKGPVIHFRLPAGGMTKPLYLDLH